MNAPTPGDGPSGTFGTADAESLVAAVDALLSSDAVGTAEAELLENAHRVIADALEGR